MRNQEEIKIRAYEYYQRRIRHNKPGNADTDWAKATRDVEMNEKRRMR